MKFTNCKRQDCTNDTMIYAFDIPNKSGICILLLLLFSINSSARTFADPTNTLSLEEFVSNIQEVTDTTNLSVPDTSILLAPQQDTANEANKVDQLILPSEDPNPLFAFFEENRSGIYVAIFLHFLSWAVHSLDGLGFWRGAFWVEVNCLK